MECEFGPGVSTNATVHLDSGPAQIQTCPLLSRENYQPILPGTGKIDHAFIGQCARLISLRHTSTFTECYLKEKKSFELYQNRCNFPFQLSEYSKVSEAWGRTVVKLWYWYHLECLTHATLLTCLCFFRSSDCFCGDKGEWHICGIRELHNLWLREDGSNTSKDIVSHTSIVYLKF